MTYWLVIKRIGKVRDRPIKICQEKVPRVKSKVLRKAKKLLYFDYKHSQSHNQIANVNMKVAVDVPSLVKRQGIPTY